MAGWLKPRGTRIALGIAAFLVLLVILAPRLVPVGRVRDLVVTRARAATGAEVSFGAASVRLLPRLSVAVADGKIVGTGEALRQATGQPTPLVSYQASLDRLEVSLALGPLLRKRVEIGRVRLIHPRIEIVTAPQAPATAAKGGGAAKASADAEAAPFALAMAGLEVRDGALTWREEGTGRVVTIEGWEQTVTAGDLSALSGRLRALGAASSAVAPGGAEASLGLSTRVGGITLEGFGKVSPLRLQDLALEAKAVLPATGDALRLTITRAAWGRVELSGDARLGGATGGERRLTGSWKLSEQQLPALMAVLLPLAPPLPGPGGPWLAAQPVQAGQLAAAGGFDLPWPLPSPTAPDLVMRGLTAEGSVRQARVKLPDGRAEIALESTFALRDGALALTGLQLSDGGGIWRITGEARLPLPPLAGRLRGDLQGTLDLGAAAPLLALLPDPPPAPGQPPAPGAWKEYRYTGQAEFTARADVPDAPPLNAPLLWRQRLEDGGLPGVRISGTVSGLTLEGPRLAPALAVSKVAFESNLRTATVKLEGAVHPVLAGDGNVQLTRLLPDPHAEVDLRLSRFDADALTAMVTATPAATNDAPRADLAPPCNGLSPLLAWAVGTAVAAVPGEVPTAPPGETIPPRLTASYRAATDQMTLGKIVYEQVVLSGSLADRVFTVPQATARLGGGTVAGSGKVDYVADPWGQLDFKAKIQGVPAVTLLTPYVKGAASLWEGKVAGEIGGACRIRDARSVLASLALEGDAISTDGVIHGSQFLEEVSGYLGARQDLKEVRFEDFRHHLQVKDGRYIVRDLTLRGFDTDWWGDGWVGFDGGIDLRLTVKLPAGFKPELGEFGFLADGLRGADGRLALTLLLTGRAAQPAIGLDLTGAKAKTQQKVQDDVKKGVDRLLDKIKR